MLLVISFQRLEAVRDYSLDSSFERFETISYPTKRNKV
jgi:hypothetical protein